MFIITTVISEVYLQCCTELVSLRDISKPTWRGEIISPSSLFFKQAPWVCLSSSATSTSVDLTFAT